MDLIWSLMVAAGGLTLLAVGGDRLVAAASGLSLRGGLSPLATGVVIVGFATSAPEIFVSVLAAIGGQVDVAHANIIGSNIANAWLVLGCGGLIFPLVVRAPGVMVSAVILLAASLLWSGVTSFWYLNAAVGGLFLAALAAYLTWVCRAVPHMADESADSDDSGIILLLAWLGLAVVALPVGAHLLIHGALEIADLIGIGSDTVGLTLVAIGTSLPELAATVASVARQRSDLVIGNVIGSNLFNILAAGGAVALAGAGPLSAGLAWHGNLVMLAAAASIAAPVVAGIVIGRGIGAMFLGLYAAYMVFLVGIEW